MSMSMSSRQSIRINGLTVNAVYNDETNTLNVSVVSDNTNGQNRNVQLASVELYNVPPAGLLIVENANQYVSSTTHVLTPTIRNPQPQGGSVTATPRRPPPRRAAASSSSTDVDRPQSQRRVRPRLSAGNSSGPIVSPVSAEFHHYYSPLVVAGGSSSSSLTAPLYPMVDWRSNYPNRYVVEGYQHFYPYYPSQIGDRHNEDTIPHVVPPLPDMFDSGLSEEQIMACLRPTKYCHDFFDDAAFESCCICQEEYAHQEDINSLRCNHLFHHKCIKRWLMENVVCPVCRANVTEE